MSIWFILFFVPFLLFALTSIWCYYISVLNKENLEKMEALLEDDTYHSASQC